jgi:predicted AlkP superfamily pyrophosphatase or phosphodiesterase
MDKRAGEDVLLILQEAGKGMLNATSLNAVSRSRFSSQFVQPLYESYSFARLPATIQYLLGGTKWQTLPPDVLGSLPTRYNKVVLFFVDGFGWRFFERYAERYPLLNTFLQEGVVSKLTSQFPSTTPAHVTCIYTGQHVAQSGIYEWQFYEPSVDALIAPLRFAYAGDSQADTLKTSGLPAETFYPGRTFQQTLQSQGIQSHIFQSAAYIHSTYSQMMLKGATSRHPFRTLADALEQLVTHVLNKEESPAYYLIYYDKIDAAGHGFGPTSSEIESTIEYFFQTLEQLFYHKLRGLTGDTLLLLTADHGQVDVFPETTFYLNQRLPALTRFFQTNRQGQPLVPAGSARDMFLHIREADLDEAVTLLTEQLAGRAEVYRTSDFIARNFFGSPTPSPTFLSRVGNVVILPYANETVWWYEEDRFDMHFSGHHGGLTPQEMEIPLLALPL